MLLLLAYVVLSYFVIDWVVKNGDDVPITRKSDKLFVFFIGFGVAAIIYITFCIIITGNSSYKQEYTEHGGKTGIVAFENVSSLHGSFFLASGYIESAPHFVFFYQLPNGAKKLGKVQAENAEIYEEDRKDGYMAKLKERKVYPTLQTWSWLFLPEFMQDSSWYDRGKYVFHVPKGTIKTGFALNLKDLK